MKLLYKCKENYDKCEIYKYRKNVRFSIACDGTGFSFVIPKQELINYLNN